MISQVLNIIHRSPTDVIHDMIGVGALVVVILVGLSLPGMA